MLRYRGWGRTQRSSGRPAGQWRSTVLQGAGQLASWGVGTLLRLGISPTASAQPVPGGRLGTSLKARRPPYRALTRSISVSRTSERNGPRGGGGDQYYAVLPPVVSSIGVPLIFTVKIHQIEARVGNSFRESRRNS